MGFRWGRFHKLDAAEETRDGVGDTLSARLLYGFDL